MIYGLTGAHGTGKSTIIKGVKEFGVNVVESSLSRIAQAQLGWNDLSPAEESEENMWTFQTKILEAMFDRDIAILESRELTLVDRTPADVWGYVSLWSSKIGKVDETRAKVFKGQCRALAAKYTEFIFVPISEHIPFVAEPNRAGIDTRDFHEKEVAQFILSGSLPHSTLITTNADQRVKHLAVRLNSIKNNKELFEKAI